MWYVQYVVCVSTCSDLENEGWKIVPDGGCGFVCPAAEQQRDDDDDDDILKVMVMFARYWVR